MRIDVSALSSARRGVEQRLQCGRHAVWFPCAPPSCASSPLLTRPKGVLSACESDMVCVCVCCSGRLVCLSPGQAHHPATADQTEVGVASAMRSVRRGKGVTFCSPPLGHLGRENPDCQIHSGRRTRGRPQARSRGCSETSPRGGHRDRSLEVHSRDVDVVRDKARAATWPIRKVPHPSQLGQICSISSARWPTPET